MAFVLIAVRIALPYVGKHLINRELRTRMGEYTGSIDDFNLHLYRGAYSLKHLIVRKKAVDMPPILEVGKIDLQISWRALLRKEIATHVIIDQAIVQLFDSKEPKKKQLGVEEKGWQDMLDALLPVSIESLGIYRSAISFANHDVAKGLPIHLDDITFTATDLRNRHYNDKELRSRFRFDAVLQKHAKVFADGKLDAMAKPPTVDVDFGIEGFETSSVNALLLTYVPIDITHGKLDLYGEAATEKGDATGYVKLFLKDADIVAPKQKYKSVEHFLVELAGSFGNWLLENNKSKRVATEIPFSRYHGHLNVNSSKAFWSTIKNKWGDHPLPRGISNTVSIESVRKLPMLTQKSAVKEKKREISSQHDSE